MSRSLTTFRQHSARHETKILTKKSLVLLLPFFASAAVARDLPPGTVVDASNLDAHQNDDFKGVPLNDLLTEGLKALVRDHGLRIELAEPKPIGWDESYKKLTAKYAANVKLDPKTKMISGYTAGVPFPAIDSHDPNAAAKVVWNAFYAFPNHGGSSFSGPMWNILIDGKNGVDRIQKWQFISLPMQGRLEPPHDAGDGSIAKKEALVAIYPQDIRGLGTFTIRYADGRLDDTWVYIQAVRRIRRVAGGTWMDPVGGADFLYDDINGFNAHPSWYESYRYLGKKTILAYWLHNPPRDMSSKEGALSYIDTEHAPYWNPKFVWEPVDTHVIEAVPPKRHPYSKKILYYSVQHPGVVNQGLYYDKKGALWKVNTYGVGAVADSQGKMRMTRYVDFIVDLKTRHSTVAIGDGVRSETIDPAQLTPSILERGSL